MDFTMSFKSSCHGDNIISTAVIEQFGNCLNSLAYTQQQHEQRGQTNIELSSICILDDTLVNKLRQVCDVRNYFHSEICEFFLDYVGRYLVKSVLPVFQNLLSLPRQPVDEVVLRSIQYLYTLYQPWLNIARNIDNLINCNSSLNTTGSWRMDARRQRWASAMARNRAEQESMYKMQVHYLQQADGSKDKVHVRNPDNHMECGVDGESCKPHTLEDRTYALLSTHVILHLTRDTWTLIADLYRLAVSTYIHKHKAVMKDVSAQYGGRLNDSDLSTGSCCGNLSAAGADDLLPEVGGDRCAGCRGGSCRCHDVIANLNTINTTLLSLKLLERVSSESIKEVTSQKVREQVRFTCQGNFDISWTSFLKAWLEKLMFPFLEQTFMPTGSNADTTFQNQASAGGGMCCATLRASLLHLLYSETCVARIEQLFEIIIDYDDSEPALTDLAQCLPRCSGSLRLLLIRSLRHAMDTRLLHPGVDTKDILSAYMYAMRALRVLDSTGVIFEQTCEPIKKYLRARDDTVRCIMASLLEESSDMDLVAELRRGAAGPAGGPGPALPLPLLLDDVAYVDDEFDHHWRDWYPDPADADPTRSSRSRRTSDVISTLVNIYGSKDLFVNEYRNLLAEHILTNKAFLPSQAPREMTNLELLKKKFGDAQLINCEVMLKDLKDSSQLNKMIQERNSGCVSAMLLSGVCWPKFISCELQLPAPLQAALDQYRSLYTAHTGGDRTIEWLPHLGRVTLCLEVPSHDGDGGVGGGVEVTADPIQASIIWYFTEKEVWRVDELSEALSCDVSLVRKKICFWQSQGLLVEAPKDVFTLWKEGMELRLRRKSLNDLTEDDEADSIMASLQQQKLEELELFFKYMCTVMKTTGSVTFDKVGSLLKMFSEGVEYTNDEIKEFLLKKVSEGLLIYTGGSYRIPKVNTSLLE